MSRSLGSTVSRVVSVTKIVPGAFSFDLVKSHAGVERMIVPIALDVILDADAAGVSGVTWDGVGDKFDKESHGFVNGDRVVVQGTGLPIGEAPNRLSLGDVYVVLNASADDFDLALASTPTTPIDLGTSNALTGITFYRSTPRLWGSLEATLGSQGGSEWVQIVIRSYPGSTVSYDVLLDNVKGANPAAYQAAATGPLVGPAIDRGAFLTASGDTE